MQLIKEDSTGSKFQAEGFKVYYKNKGTVAGDNSVNPEELIYLIVGTAEIHHEDKMKKISAPSEIRFPARKYHKIVAVTDIVFLIIKQ